MPDFKEWANTVKLSRYPDAMQSALAEAFAQGRHLGRKEQDSLWWEEQDKCLGNNPTSTESFPSCLGSIFNTSPRKTGYSPICAGTITGYTVSSKEDNKL